MLLSSTVSHLFHFVEQAGFEACLFVLQILDEKSLIKKYQKEITSLKTELEQLKRGIMEQPYVVKENSEDLAHLRQQVHEHLYLVFGSHHVEMNS